MFFSFGESIGRLICREQERRKGQADDIKVRYLRVLLKRMANDAVAMLNPPRRKRVKEKGWWLRCEVRGEGGKKPGRKALLADTRRAGLFVVSAWLGEAVVHTSGRRARFAAQVGVGSRRKKTGKTLQVRRGSRAGQAWGLVQCCERKGRRGLCRKGPEPRSHNTLS